MKSLLARPDVAAARAWIEAQDAATLRLQRTISGIPSPPFNETARAAFIAEEMRTIGLADVHSDEIGNVFARYGDQDGSAIVVCSHLDTVFPIDTRVETSEDGARIHGPGIGDNARGLAALLTLAEALVRHRVKTPPVLFMASVGEEGEGDLRGVKHFFGPSSTQHPAPITGFIALDGPGLDRIVHRALGSRRLRGTFRGPGGHSWAAFGVANPAHAVGVATAKIGEIPLPASPRAALSVVRIGGGQSLNTIPDEAWLELDIRAEADAVLDELYNEAVSAMHRAAELVSRRRSSGTPALTVELTSLGERPSGTTAEESPLVQASIAATRAVGGSPALATASTDANVAISRGIPGVALGAGGKGGDAHLLSEWYENANGPAGIVRCLLTVLGTVDGGR